MKRLELSEAIERFNPFRELREKESVAAPLHHVADCFLMEGPMAWIVSDADHLGGKPRVRDTRIAVPLLLEWLAKE